MSYFLYATMSLFFFLFAGVFPAPADQYCANAATQLLVWQCMMGWRTDATYDPNDKLAGVNDQSVGTEESGDYNGVTGAKSARKKRKHTIRKQNNADDAKTLCAAPSRKIFKKSKNAA